MEDELPNHIIKFKINWSGENILVGSSYSRQCLIYARYTPILSSTCSFWMRLGISIETVTLILFLNVCALVDLAFYVFQCRSFWQAIDAVDNGINQYDTDKPPRYVNNTNLSSRVKSLNLDWVDLDQSSDRENEAFQQAMTLAGSEFLEVWHFSSLIVCVCFMLKLFLKHLITDWQLFLEHTFWCTIEELTEERHQA